MTYLAYVCKIFMRLAFPSPHSSYSSLYSLYVEPCHGVESKVKITGGHSNLGSFQADSAGEQTFENPVTSPTQ